MCVLVLVRTGRAPLTVVHVKDLIKGMPHKPANDAPEGLKLMYAALCEGKDHGSIFEDFNAHMKDIQADTNLSPHARGILLGYLPSVYLRLVARLIISNTIDAESYSKVSC